ncbi:MAG TPA: histidine kinase [Sphingomicrobium sp.]|nr:histidine kinase [Sphingomicrobium sp.]
MIAVGRYMLSALLFFAMLVDRSPIGDLSSTVFKIVCGYVVFALVMVAVTWKDWWLDARLAGPAHALDIITFTWLVYMVGPDDSPYFTFFVFILLSAAIRWGWRATTLTAILLISLYLMAGFLAAGFVGSPQLHTFVDRTGHLIILSAILVWFGVNQWHSGLARTSGAFADPSPDESPLETGLRAAMRRLNAGSGVLVWRDQTQSVSAITDRDGVLSVTQVKHSALRDPDAGALIYERSRDRALAQDEGRNFNAIAANEVIRAEMADSLELTQGIAVPIRTGAGEGELFLESLPNLSTDHIDLGTQVASELAGHIERHALMIAVEESAEARSRLALARDLHDSVVQFLAGAAFRLEAVKRDLTSGRNLEPELNYLKQLMLQEQGELRSFIAALRSAPQIGVGEIARDLRALSERLAEQWNVLCEFSAHTTDMMVPSRLHLDAQHLTREAVANAVRHAGAKSVTIRLRSEDEQLKLDFINDGARFPASPLGGEMPRSLSERVKLAGGALELTRGMGVTRISVSLPIGGRAH